MLLDAVFQQFSTTSNVCCNIFVFVAGNVPDLSFEMKKLSPKVVSNPQSRKGHSAKMAGAGHRRHCIKAKTQVLAEMSLRSLRQEALAQKKCNAMPFGQESNVSGLATWSRWRYVSRINIYYIMPDASQNSLDEQEDTFPRTRCSPLPSAGVGGYDTCMFL